MIQPPDIQLGPPVVPFLFSFLFRGRVPLNIDSEKLVPTYSNLKLPEDLASEREMLQGFTVISQPDSDRLRIFRCLLMHFRAKMRAN